MEINIYGIISTKKLRDNSFSFKNASNFMSR